MNNGTRRTASPAMSLMVAQGLVAVVMALCVCAAYAGVADAASSGFNRVGAFAETPPDGQLTHQGRIAVDNASGNILVTDVVNDQVAVYQPYGGNSAYVVTTFGAGVVTDPLGIAIDQATGDV